MRLPIQRVLKNGIAVEVDEMRSDEQETVRSLLNQIVLAGITYPQSQPLSEPEFAAYWLHRDAFVVRRIEDTLPNPSHDTPKLSPPEVLGAFYLKPNFPGRSGHICNAGFIVQPTMQGLGLGRLMAEAMLAIAPTQGYTAVMFNLVFATNTPSLNLWKSLGFSTIGRIPKAAHLATGETVDAIMLYYAFDDLA